MTMTMLMTEFELELDMKSNNQSIHIYISYNSIQIYRSVYMAVNICIYIQNNSMYHGGFSFFLSLSCLLARVLATCLLTSIPHKTTSISDRIKGTTI